ncbi:MAG: hypothetical protein MMC23_007741 [Stictis urceolatum]|nr:hypothetical protein [Stictis urceolata]
MDEILKVVSVQSIVGALAFYLVTLGLYRLIFHPLAKFPGPKLAAVSRYYEAYHDVIQDGQYTNKIAELHRSYGPIIRISPHELHINDPSFYEKLYRQEGHWNKYAWSYDAFGAPLSAICTLDHSLHKRRIAALGAYFSKASISSRHDLIIASIRKLRNRIREYATSGAPLNLGTAVSAMTTDIATEFIVGKNYNNLDRKDFNQDMTNMLQSSGGMWRTTKHVRFLGPLMKAMPLSLLDKMGDPADSKSQTQSLVSEYHAGSYPAPSSSPTLVHSILQNPGLPEAEKSLNRVNEEIETITGAGLETTAQTLRLIVFYLYRDPAALQRLRSELRTLLQEILPSDQPSLTQLEQLPYLTAVIMEGLRLSPGIATRMARITPDRVLVYGDNRVIPAGTPVGMTTLLMHLDESIYKKAYQFNPDRWADLEQRKGEVGRTFAPFSRGTRMCLGMNLAWAELYFTVAMLVSTFNLDLGETSAEDVDFHSDQFVLGTKSKNGVRVTASLC